MKDLIERLEKATENTRSLFEEAYLAATGKPCWADGERGDFFQQCLNIGAWVSATLTLVPEGWAWMIGCDFEATFFTELQEITGDYVGREVSVKGAPSAALALCIAALKAGSEA